MNNNSELPSTNLYDWKTDKTCETIKAVDVSAELEMPHGGDPLLLIYTEDRKGEIVQLRHGCSSVHYHTASIGLEEQVHSILSYMAACCNTTKKKLIDLCLKHSPTNMATTQTHKPTPKTVDLMIDIETMGNTPGCAILSIGAVFIKDGKLAEEFYQKIDLESCLDVGLKMDASTVLWWMKQSDEARASITGEKGDHIIEVLGLFSRWAFAHGSGVGEVNVWGNAATFDVVLMEEAFRKTHINIPWEFWGHRCFRTLKNLCPSVPKPVFTGIKHHALDDAKWQALHMITILEHINCLQNALDSATKPNTPNEQDKPTIQSPGFVATNAPWCPDNSTASYAAKA